PISYPRTWALKLAAGFEPATSSLPRKCSTPELRQRGNVHDLRSDRHNERAGTGCPTSVRLVEAGDGNRTHAVGLEGRSSTTELRPRIVSLAQRPRITVPHSLPTHACVDHSMWEWGRQDSNLCRLAPTGLQPVPFGRSGTPPLGTHSELCNQRSR